ncbi:MAG: M14 family zinc carboxypeptidase, partial [Gaiellaceae bacterium]
MRKRIPLLLAAGVAVLVSIAPASTVAAPQACDPTQTTPVFRGEVPTAEEVLGFPLGSQEVTSAESDTYVAAVDAASPRVVSDVLGTSWQGRPLTYA